MNKVVLLLALIIAFGCKNKATEEPVVEIDTDLEELFAVMAGSYNSSRQAKADTTYFDISLQMAPIWQDREGYWLYVEQSLSDSLEKPYRQRIYKLSRENDSLLRSDIFTFPNESLWIGKWETPETFDRLLFESLTERKGCEVLLIKTGENSFVGKTIDKNCPSDLRGALYATSELEISEHSITSWDRVFNENDSLVWGAQKGGYVFDKIRE
ncbi:MAG: chromophore lyase CpcT/CpeT [Flavobacteriaceae bacterium]